MPTPFRFENDFDIDPAAHWEIFFSEPYNAALFEALKVKDCQILEMEDDGRVVRRTLRLTPATEIPPVFRSVIKDPSYTEYNFFDRNRSEMEIRVETALMKERLKIRGTCAVKPLGPGRCRRIFAGECQVSIMLLGSTFEKYMVDQMRVSDAVGAEVTHRWIEKYKQEKAAGTAV